MAEFTRIVTVTQKELLANRDLLDQFISLFIGIYNTEWNEDWTPEQVEEQVSQDIYGIYTLGLDSENIKGFACGSVIPFGLFKENPKSAQCDHEEINNSIKKHLWDLSGQTKVLHFREFVIERPYRRGFGPIVRISLEILKRAQEQGVQHILMRTANNVPMYNIANSLQFQVVYQYPDGINVIMAHSEIQNLLEYGQGD
jgi:hypothetical protein